MASSRIYLDHNATTPARAEVVEAMRPFWSEEFGNPSSAHRLGQNAASALEAARARVATLFGAFRADEVVFTSGGSEANALAIRGTVSLRPSQGRILASPVEHDAAWALLEQLAAEGYQIEYLSVDPFGRVDPVQVRERLNTAALLVVMQANNEVGTLQPIEEIGAIAREFGVPLHVDSVQAAGKAWIQASKWGATTVSISGHKFGATKGIGALWVRTGHKIRPLVPGHHEGGRRSGTQNVAQAVGLGAACELALADLNDHAARLASLRDGFEASIKNIRGGAWVNGHPVFRTANVSHVSFAGVKGESLAIALDMEGIAVSTGSACASGSSKPSHVLAAMGLPLSRQKGAIRFSLGRQTTQEDLDRTEEALLRLVPRLRKAEFP
ncbi:MAG: cysteine desulfurase family protein [Elusimicrobiota bacterium]